jgi:hypothetical protein
LDLSQRVIKIVFLDFQQSLWSHWPQRAIRQQLLKVESDLGVLAGWSHIWVRRCKWQGLVTSFLQAVWSMEVFP